MPKPKKRRVHEPLKLHENPETGKDPKDLNRGAKVEVGNKDQQRCEFSKGEVQQSNDKGKNVDAKFLNAQRPLTMKREAQSITNLIQAGKAKTKRIEGS